MKYNYVNDHTTEDYQVTDISWERIFLKFCIETRRDNAAEFSLRHFERRRRRRKRDERSSQIFDMWTFEELPKIGRAHV